MTQVMYKRDDGAVGYFHRASGQQILTSTGWKPLDAKSLPYTSQVSGSIDNVSHALDVLLKATADLRHDIAGVLEQARRMDAENDAITAQVMASVHITEQQVAAAVALVERSTHKAVALSRSSNPALQFEPISQTIRFDLSAPGSFDDSATRIGATSIQSAFIRLAVLIAELRNDYNRLYADIVAVSNKGEDQEARLALLEKKWAEQQGK